MVRYFDGEFECLFEQRFVLALNHQRGWRLIAELSRDGNAAACNVVNQFGPRLAQRRTEEAAAWWVFIAPQANRPAALKKGAELKALAVEDYFIVQDEGPLRWAVSLGVYRTEEAAQARLAALRDQGVRSAQVGARETGVPKIWLQVKGVDSALQGRLADIARTVEGTELRECAP